VLQMISWVSCSKNGNCVPSCIKTSGAYHLLGRSPGSHGCGGSISLFSIQSGR
jgi:hypothetical protein